MIAIINQLKRNERDETLYHILINKEFIAKFWHKRADGLAICLQKASETVMKEDNTGTVRIANKLMQLLH